MQQALDTDTKINARYDLHYQNPEMEEWRRIGAFGKAENIISMCSSIPHDRIIDVGCGEGAVLEQLLEKDFSKEYVGAEISDGALELLRRKERLKDVELIQIDDYAIDVQDQRFDLAVLSHVLEQLELATLEWVWWFNHKRLLESNGYIPPVEYEEAFHSRNETHTLDAVLT